MNTHEIYVSLEIAKLLKEAGFDWECSGHWVETNKDNKDALLVLPSEPCLYGPNLVDDNLNMYMICVKNYNAVEDEIGFQFYYSAPTLAVAQKWLRETKGYAVYPTRGGYKIYVLNENDSAGFSKTYVLNATLSYDAAIEAGIKVCLDLILEEKCGN